MFSQNTLLQLSSPVPLELIENQTLNIQNFTGLNDAYLEFILENEEILEALRVREINFESLVSLMRNEDLNDIEQAREENSIVDIVEKYEENPLNLGFMADANGFMYENSDNGKIIEFGKENYREILDIEMIRGMISGDRKDSSALMYFDSII